MSTTYVHGFKIHKSQDSIVIELDSSHANNRGKIKASVVCIGPRLVHASKCDAVTTHCASKVCNTSIRRPALSQDIMPKVTCYSCNSVQSQKCRVKIFDTRILDARGNVTPSPHELIDTYNVLYNSGYGGVRTFDGQELACGSQPSQVVREYDGLHSVYFESAMDLDSTFPSTLDSEGLTTSEEWKCEPFRFGYNPEHHALVVVGDGNVEVSGVKDVVVYKGSRVVANRCMYVFSDECEVESYGSYRENPIDCEFRIEQAWIDKAKLEKLDGNATHKERLTCCKGWLHPDIPREKW